MSVNRSLGVQIKNAIKDYPDGRYSDVYKRQALYIGNGDEAQGIATGCIRTNGSTCEGTGSPEKKSFRSEHGKGMDLYPQRMGLDGGETGKITFEDETGTTIESNGGLVPVSYTHLDVYKRQVE